LNTWGSLLGMNLSSFAVAISVAEGRGNAWGRVKVGWGRGGRLLGGEQDTRRGMRYNAYFNSFALLMIHDVIRVYKPNWLRPTLRAAF